jgi:hypothetical protein
VAGVYRLHELQYSAESSFAENAESPSSNTWEKRIPVKSYTLTTSQERIRDGGLQARMNSEALSMLGPREAELSFTCNWTGHFTTTAGALTPTWQQDLLSDGLGGGSTAFAGTTASAGSSGSSFTYTSTSNLASGMIVRVGIKGDGKGDGQCAVVNSVASPVTHLTALPGTPANGDVIYATQVAYHDESTAGSLGTKRFLCGYSSSPTAGAQYMLMGGQLAGLSVSIPTGQNAVPEITFTYRFAYWARSAVTIPSSSLSLENNWTGPVVGNQVFYQAKGTATSATIQAAQVNLTIDLGLEPIYGGTLNGTYQQVGGWQRTMCKPSLSMVVPWQTAQETLFDTANSSYTARHVLWNSNAINGYGVGFYLPDAFHVGNRPSQPVEINSQLYTPINLVGRDSGVTTSELTQSAVRLFSY